MAVPARLTKGTPTILLIAPDAEVREVLRLCLHDFGGWNVITALSTQEGFQTLATEHLDAILLDLLIPEETGGLQLIQILRAYPQGRSIPIILITDSARWLNSQQIYEMGVMGAIAKPFNPLTLPQQLARLLHWTIDANH